MRSKTLVCVVVAGAALFASGIAVGQKAATPKFTKYLQPMDRTEMDFITLEATVNNIHESLPRVNGISEPEFYFNYKENRLEAFAMIDAEFEKASVAVARRQITATYNHAYFGLVALIPDLAPQDFGLKVYRDTTDSAHKLFAECNRGNVVFQ